MCNASVLRSAPCNGANGNRMNTTVKLLKCELPIPSSKTYWDGVCAEIEKKYRRVRDPYPYPFPLSESLTYSPTTQLSDNIKFKISPPTPMNEKQKFESNLIDQEQNKKARVTKDKKRSIKFSNNVKEMKLPLDNTNKKCLEPLSQISKSIKIYSKNSCPHHKNVDTVKIFDDEITKYLQKRESSILKLPSLAKENKLTCKHHEMTRSKSTPTSSRIDETNTGKRISKIPKLGAASLLPSFAKAVSIDSSVGTQESCDSEDDSVKSRLRDYSFPEIKRDFLRLPNLNFASSHPSFHKLSSNDSYDDDIDTRDISIMSEEDFANAKKRLRNEKKVITFKDEIVDNDEKIITQCKTSDLLVVDEKPKTMSNYGLEYSYKALESITKRKHFNLNSDNFVVTTKSSTSEESESFEIRKSKMTKSQRSKTPESPIDFKEIAINLRNNVKKNIDTYTERKSSNINVENNLSVSIYSASRSTSGASPDFENNIKDIPSNQTLEMIPKTKVFCRAHIDKCHACLYKPFEKSLEVKRELPLTALKFIIDNPFDFRGSSSSSSSSAEELHALHDNKFIFTQSDTDLYNVVTKNEIQDEKDHVKMSFGEKNVVIDIPESPEQYVKDRSLSVQSTDRSKTSTPTNQSSDSDEVLLQEDRLPSSKYMAPCHAPVVWRPSLEPLKALKSKKAMSLRARAAAITAKSSEGSSSDSNDEGAATSKLISKKPKRVPIAVDQEIKEVTKKKEKPKKPLVRMKTVAEDMTSLAMSADEMKDGKPHRMLKRAKTTFDLTTIDDGSTSESDDDADLGSQKLKDLKQKDEPLPYFEAILLHRPGPPPPPIMSSEYVISVIKTCVENNLSVSELLETLGEEFSRKINERCKELENIGDIDYLKLGYKLFNALLDSRRYLKSDIFCPNLEFPFKQPPLVNARQLRRILPPKAYELVAPILGMPKYYSKKSGDNKLTHIRERTKRNFSDDEESNITFDLVVHPPTSPDSSGYGDKFSVGDRKTNPYALFLRKPRRKAVVWRPLCEDDMKGYDPEATLEMRATRLMNKICKDFCEWFKHLGGNEQAIDEETLKDMFEINFSSEACKATQIVIKEIPTVTTAIANIRRCRKASKLQKTRKEIKNDLKVERRRKRTFAFGRCLPSELRFVPPRNRIYSKWLRCNEIPDDLKTMDVVWKGIIHLDSVQTFLSYLKENPKAASPKLANNLEVRSKLAKKREQTVDAVNSNSLKVRNGNKINDASSVIDY